MASAVAKVVSDQAQVEAAEAAQQLAKVTFERWRDSPKGVVSDQERDSTKAGYQGAIARLDVARAQLKVDQADADRYRVLTKFKQVGPRRTPARSSSTPDRHRQSTVTAGSNSSTTSLYKVAQNDPMRVFVDVPQSAATDMNPGVGASITASNIPDRVFVGKIARTADAIDQRARTLRVEVDIPNPISRFSSPGCMLMWALRYRHAGCRRFLRQRWFSVPVARKWRWWTRISRSDSTASPLRVTTATRWKLGQEIKAGDDAGAEYHQPDFGGRQGGDQSIQRGHCKCDLDPRNRPVKWWALGALAGYRFTRSSACAVRT